MPTAPPTEPRVSSGQQPYVLALVAIPRKLNNLATIAIANLPSLSISRRTAAACAISALVVCGIIPEGAIADRLAFVALVTLVLSVAAGYAQFHLRGRIRRPPGTNLASESSKEWLAVVILVAVVSGVALQTWFKAGTSIATGDITPPIGVAWIGRMFEPWLWTGSNLGEPSQLSQDLPWALMTGSVHLLGGDAETAQRIWYTAIYMGAALSAVGLIAALGMRPLAGLVGAAVYVLNPYVVSVVNTYPVYVIALGLLAGLPAVMIAIGRRKWPIRWGALAMVGAAPLLGTAFFNPPLVGMILGASLATPLLVGWTDGRDAAIRTLKAACVLLILVAALSAFWLIPAIVHLSGGAAPQLASISSWAWTETRATLRNAFWLNSLWGWKYPEYFPYAPIYDAFPVAAAKFVLPAIAFGALALPDPSGDGMKRHMRDRTLRLALAASTVALLVILLSTGTRAPGNVLFDRLYQLPFGWLLREPGRFLMIAGLAYALLVAAVTQTMSDGGALSQLLRVPRDYRAILGATYAPAALATSILVGFPLLTGVVVPDTRPVLPSAHVRVPDYWSAMAQFTDSLPIQGGVLVMPPDDFYQMSYKWGYYGNDDFIGRLFNRPVLVPNRQGYFSTSLEVSSAVELTSQSILRHNWSETEALVAASNTPLILVRRDINSKTADGAIVPADELSRGLATSPNFVLMRQIGSLDLFALTSRTRQTEPDAPMATIDTRTPDLRLLPQLPAGSYLVSTEPRAGVPSVAQAPPVELWKSSGAVLEWITSAPSRSSNRLIDLATNTTISLDRHGTVAGPNHTQVSYAPDASVNQVSVTIPSRPTLANSDFARGLWGPVSDCYSSDPTAARLNGEVVANGAPGGLPALRLAASLDSACETQRLWWKGGPLIVSLQVRHIGGAAPRLCLWEAVREKCAPLPDLPNDSSWSWYRTSVTPDAGTTAINLYLYADGGNAHRTVNEYANVSVAEVASLPSLALLSSPQLSIAPSSRLVVTHSSYSPAWQASAGEHVLVDGMLNGWLVRPGSKVLTLRYGPGTLVHAGQLASLVVLLVTVAVLIWPWISPLTRSRYIPPRIGEVTADDTTGKP